MNGKDINNILSKKNKYESKRLESEIKNLEKQENEIRIKLNKGISSIKKYRSKLYNKDISTISVITLSMVTILISLFMLILNVNLEFFFNGAYFQINQNIWNNIFFLGLSGLTIGYIFYQIRKSAQQQFKITMINYEIAALEKIQASQMKTKSKMVHSKSLKYIYDVPERLVDKEGKEFIPVDSLNPDLVSDPDVKQMLLHLQPELKKSVFEHDIKSEIKKTRKKAK
jgi:hypothetical protein